MRRPSPRTPEECEGTPLSIGTVVRPRSTTMPVGVSQSPAAGVDDVVPATRLEPTSARAGAVVCAC